MTRRQDRVYPVKVNGRDLALHRTALMLLGQDGQGPFKPGTKAEEYYRLGVEEHIARLRHRIACAERWEETRTKRLTPSQRDTVTFILRGATAGLIDTGNADQAAALARSLVRITRDPA